MRRRETSHRLRSIAGFIFTAAILILMFGSMRLMGLADSDLTGTWSHIRQGGIAPEAKGVVRLARTATCDEDGYICFTGTTRNEIQKQGKSFLMAVKLKGQDVKVCPVGASRGECFLASCSGTLAEDEITAKCVIGLDKKDFGSLVMKRQDTGN